MPDSVFLTLPQIAAAVSFVGLFFVLIAVAVIDWKTMLIPDRLLAAGAVCGALWIWVGNISLPDALFGALAGALPLLILDYLTKTFAGKPGFGFGDVKLMAMSGLFLGWTGVASAFFYAFIAGGIVGVVLLVSRRAERGSYIPFAPFLCGGVFLALLMRVRG